MADDVLLYLSLLVAIASLTTIIARIIRQPPIIAYLIAGIIVGPVGLGIMSQTAPASEFIQTFAHIGVAFLLFIVGLNLDIRVFKELGKVALGAGLTEVFITGTIGFLITLGLGFQFHAALYLGAALAFSSTVVVVKILADKREIDTLHGRITLGILIIEDIVAAIALMAFPLIESGSWLGIARQLGMAVVLIAVIIGCATLFHKKLLDYLARSQESLFLFGIAWALILATLFDMLGFSLEIGALVAGMSLASSKYNLELGGKIKPLRDFFVVLFFVFFGSQLTAALSLPLIGKALLLSLFVIVGKPLIVMSVLKGFGFTKRTNFLASSNLAQISEFSLILLLLGFTLGHISQEIMSLAILVALITIGISSYQIYYSKAIFTKITGLLGFFESRKKSIAMPRERSFSVIVFGSHRLGHRIIQALRKLRIPIAVIDNNPRAILALQNEGIESIFGDAGDADFIAELPLEKAKLVISTLPDEEANLVIKDMLKRRKSQAAFIATAEQSPAALDLYKQGVDYVIIPHHLGGDLMSSIIAAFKTEKSKYQKLGREHYQKLVKGKESSPYPH